jgi:hypothetical protein
VLPDWRTCYNRRNSWTQDRVNPNTHPTSDTDDVIIVAGLIILGLAYLVSWATFAGNGDVSRCAIRPSGCDPDDGRGCWRWWC